MLLEYTIPWQTNELPHCKYVFPAWKMVHQSCLKLLIPILQLSWLPVVTRWGMQHIGKAAPCLCPSQLFTEMFRCRESSIYVPYLPQTRENSSLPLQTLLNGSLTALLSQHQIHQKIRGSTRNQTNNSLLFSGVPDNGWRKKWRRKRGER